MKYLRRQVNSNCWKTLRSELEEQRNEISFYKIVPMENILNDESKEESFSYFGSSEFYVYYYYEIESFVRETLKKIKKGIAFYRAKDTPKKEYLKK